MRATGQRSAFAWLTGAFVVIFAAGLVSGELLQQYDAQLGFEREAALIADELGVRPGMTVGDVRAGTGRWTVYLARRVGAAGQVYATPGPNPEHELLSTIAEAGVDNVSVINRVAGANQTRLPVECCDAVLLRLVYHRLRDERPGIARGLFTDVQPGGRLAVIDFDAGTPAFQGGGHGIAREVVAEDFTRAGFEQIKLSDDWPNGAYCIVFRRPVAAGGIR